MPDDGGVMDDGRSDWRPISDVAWRVVSHASRSQVVASRSVASPMPIPAMSRSGSLFDLADNEDTRHAPAA
jgi:hypothetical protein